MIIIADLQPHKQHRELPTGLGSLSTSEGSCQLATAQAFVNVRRWDNTSQPGPLRGHRQASSCVWSGPVSFFCALSDSCKRRCSSAAYTSLPKSQILFAGVGEFCVRSRRPDSKLVRASHNCWHWLLVDEAICTDKRSMSQGECTRVGMLERRTMADGKEVSERESRKSRRPRFTPHQQAPHGLKGLASIFPITTSFFFPPTPLFYP